MKIVADSHIPYLSVDRVPGVTLMRRDIITRNDVRDADALLVRTRTQCNAHLLEGSAVKFVGSATIGTDHIDLDYCRHAGITVANAPGCNAPAVAQWVLSVIGHWMQHNGIFSPESLTLGIVGVGHVGSIVARWARQLGFNVLLNDPPRAAQNNDNEHFVALGELLAGSDIITFHTPLTRQGQWPTWHLCDAGFLQQAQRCRLLMNAARGAVCHTQALLQWHGDLAIDCWEGEPEISRELLGRVVAGTPHIAGYSLEGKQRGTHMVQAALARHFGLNIPPISIAAPALGAEKVSLQAIMQSYDPMADTATLRAALAAACDQAAARAAFEALRNHYDLRHEVAGV